MMNFDEMTRYPLRFKKQKLIVALDEGKVPPGFIRKQRTIFEWPLDCFENWFLL